MTKEQIQERYNYWVNIAQTAENKKLRKAARMMVLNFTKLMVAR